LKSTIDSSPYMNLDWALPELALAARWVLGLQFATCCFIAHCRHLTSRLGHLSCRSTTLNFDLLSTSRRVPPSHNNFSTWNILQSVRWALANPLAKWVQGERKFTDCVRKTPVARTWDSQSA
jgi:hypothetical protein